MSTGFPYVEIPEEFKNELGKPDVGTRRYRRDGSDEDVGPWYDALCDAFPHDKFISPGGVSMYAPVSRAGVHKRLKEGKLTVFMFHVVESKRSMFGYQKKLKHLPYAYIPVSECKAWAKELEGRPQPERDKEAAGDGDFEGHFLDKDPADKANKSIQYEHEEMTSEKLKILVQVVTEEVVSRLLPKKQLARRENEKASSLAAKIRANRKKIDGN